MEKYGEGELFVIVEEFYKSYYIVEAATTLATTTNDWANFISGQGEDGGGADTSLGHFLIIKENDFFVH